MIKNKFDMIIENLPSDIGERCPAMLLVNEASFQCEGSQGHKGRHWIRWKKVYSNHAYGIFKS